MKNQMYKSDLVENMGPKYRQSRIVEVEERGA